MIGLLSTMQYLVAAGIAFAAIHHFMDGGMTATIVAGLGFAAVMGLSWVLAMRDAAFGSEVHSVVGNVISCLALIGVLAWSVGLNTAA